jgi:translation initiation factor eIF-2B subunit beta
VVRRILRLIREEWTAATSKPPGDGDNDEIEEDDEEGPTSAITMSVSSMGNRDKTSDSQYSLSNFVLHGRPHQENLAFASIYSSAMTRNDGSKIKVKNAQSIRPALVSAIEEVLDDLETVYENVSNSAKDHIHSE